MRRYIVALCVSTVLGGCATALDTVRPVGPETDTVEDAMRWPDYVPATDRALLREAEQRIETTRKGELLVRVVDSAGDPVPEMDVVWQQISRDFQFGVDEPFDPAVWGQLVRIGVNHCSVTLDWESTEPLPGDNTAILASAAWGMDVLPSMGVSARGAATLWPVAERTPEWVRRLSPLAMRSAVDRHVRLMSRDLVNPVSVWEVLRDPILTESDALSDSPTGMIELAKIAVAAFRDVDPGTPILVNFSNPFGDDQRLLPLHFAERLQAAGVDFDVIGVQYFYNGYSARQGERLPQRTLAEIASSLESMALAGKRIHVTGVSVPSQPLAGASTETGHWGRQWSPQLQATYLKAFYTLAFANGHVDAITWQDAVDMGSQIYSGGLFEQPGAPKDSFFALAQLLRRWQTEEEGATNDQGALRFRGFAGDYRVVVRHPVTQQELAVTTHIRERELGAVTITLPPEFSAPAGSQPWVVLKRSPQRDEEPSVASQR